MEAAELLAEVAAYWDPPPELLVSEWAEKFRRLSPESSAEHGEFQMNRTPFMREIVDCYNDPDVEEWIVMKSSQVAFSENLNNILGYIADQKPGPSMLLMPTLQLATGYSKDRLDPMIRDTECLSIRIDQRKRNGQNTMLRKSFPGGYWQLVGSNSPAEISSRPIRDLMVDEWDRHARSAGKEGSPDKIAEKRQITFGGRKRMKGGTPTIKGASRTEKGFEGGDRRHYHVPCPRCGDHVPLIRERFDIDPASDHYARYQCQACDGWIEEHERFDMIRDAKAGGTARWVPHGECIESRRSYFIWAAYSPFMGWREMFDQWNEAKGDPEEEQVVVNTLFGETFEFSRVELDHEALFKSREDYDGQRLPEAVKIITAGIDTQDDRFEIEVVGWGEGEESWSIEYVTIDKDPATNEGKQALDRFLAEASYRRIDGREMTIAAAFIDSGGHRTDAVYDFVRGKQFRHIYASKGSSVVGQPVFARFSQHKKARVKLAIVGTDTAKEAIYARLAKGSDVRAKMHFPLTYALEYFSGLTSEEKVVTWKSGTPLVQWKKRQGVRQSRNEPLDCRVYALAALRSLPMASRVLRDRRPVAKKQEPEKVAGDAGAPADQPLAAVEELPAPKGQPKPAAKRANPARQRRQGGGWWG